MVGIISRGKQREIPASEDNRRDFLRLRACNIEMTPFVNRVSPTKISVCEQVMLRGLFLNIRQSLVAATTCPTGGLLRNISEQFILFNPFVVANLCL